MPNLTSYIRWRGDIPFSSQPFSDVDNLLFSALAYLDFEGIIPNAPEIAGYLPKEEADNVFPANAAPRKTAPADAAPPNTAIAQTAAAFATATNAPPKAGRVPVSKTIPLNEAARLYLENLASRKTPSITARYKDLCVALQNAERYELVRVGALVSISSAHQPNQFTALTFILPDGVRYVAFRGTGDEIEDWRQDFMISFTQTAAQTMAVKYLRCRMREASSAQFYVGGHSKGGNLALYSVMHASAMAVTRIRAVYSNDGPGICPEMRTEGYDRAVEKLVRIVPEFSVIGMLFEPDVEPIIVRSDASAIQQHDAITWQIVGSEFDTVPSLSKESTNYNHVFDGWIESASMDERKAFTKDFFDALKSGGALNVQDITGNGVNGFGTILASLVNSEKATHVALRKFGESAFAELKSLRPKDLLNSQLGVTGAAVLFLGLIFLILPRAGTHVVGYALLGLGTLLLIRKIILISVATIEDRRKKVYVLGLLLLLMVLTFIMATPVFMVVLENVIIGLAFLGLAIVLFKRTLRFREHTRITERVIGYIMSGIFAGVGIYTIAMPTTVYTVRSIITGSALVIAGLLLLAVGARREAQKRARMKM